MAKQKKENRWYHEKSTLTVFLVLRFLVILTAILSAVRRDYESVFISCFTLLLFLLPNILTKRLRVTLPSTLECIILLFVFAANILGEINKHIKNIFEHIFIILNQEIQIDEKEY